MPPRETAVTATMSATFEHGFPIGALFENRYELAERLGGGGMFGVVYRARQLSTGRTVALKIVTLQHDAATRDHRVDRLRREMRLCSELFHPNIVRLIDSGDTEDGTVYAAFEYVPGTTLKEVLATEGKLSLRETAHLLGQVLDALSCAHARGVVHRDLKPENIMITRTGARRNAMVLDFGLGGFAPEAEGWGLPRITATQEMLGTPCYAAPEQLRGEPPTTRSDLYSWGLIFIECVTGDLAVRSASVHEAIVKQLNDEPIPLPTDLPSERLRALLETVTTKIVEKRDVSIDSLLEALSALGAEAPSADIKGAEPQRSGGERRQVTVLSCRLSINRVDGARVDLEELDELLHSQRTLYSELATRRGGQIASAVGDRAILIFGYPQAREDDARQAARTALSIVGEVQQRRAQLEAEHGISLQVRIGMHTGLVIAREFRRQGLSDAVDLVGSTPQIAVRVEEKAAAGEILASLDTQRLLRREVEREPAGDCAISEIGTIVPIFRVIRMRQPAAGLETISSERETPLIGRSKQLEQLIETWREAQAGRAAVVLLTGEPGIGKSRLVRELRRHVAAEAWLGLECAAETRNSPLRPIVELLSSWDEPMDALLARHGIEVSEMLPLFAQLLSVPVDPRYPPLPRTPERAKEETLGALQTLFSRMAAQRPLVLAVEDLHWADPTTLELLQCLIEELHAPVMPDDAPRLCIVLTARPQFAPTWSLEHASLIALPHLATAEVEAMVQASLSTETSSLPPHVIDEVVRRSDGIPLFVEEVTRMLVESGPENAARDGHVAIPGSLRDLITARLDSLSAGAKETAQVASVLGREFRYDFLRVIASRPESAVRSFVRELITAGLLYQRRNVRSENYLFKHALLRDTAYESMRRAARVQLHQRAATMLRERFPEIERTQPEMLAHHFELGGQHLRALEYWRRAGEFAVRRGAYVESIRHFQSGLATVGELERSRETTEAELALRTSLNVGLIATKGYGAAEVEQNCSRAHALCIDLGDAPHLVPALYGLWTYHLLRDHRDEPPMLAARLAQVARGPEFELIATATRGITAYFAGNLATAIGFLSEASELYSSAHQRSLASSLGEEAALLAPFYRIWCLFHLGRLDEARAWQRQTEAFAAEAASPYVTAASLVFAMLLGLSLEDVDMTRTFAERAIQLSVEQRFPFFLATATCGLGWIEIAAGDAAVGIAKIQEGIGILDLTGAVVARSYWLACVAEGYLRLGNTAEGLRAVDAGLVLTEGNLNRLQDPWLHRVRGELLVLAGDPAAGEESLRTAVTKAHAAGDKPFELRAAVALARLLGGQRRGDAARRLLGATLASFAEGLDSKDVRGARSLLEELS
jgi:TOMM system kinase/cyclase fusion protein